MTTNNGWQSVVFASDCGPCPHCEEPFCGYHNLHYADCDCIGPGQEDEHEYKEVEGMLYAKPKNYRISDND